MIECTKCRKEIPPRVRGGYCECREQPHNAALRKAEKEYDDLLDEIMAVLPEHCRTNSLGARDGLKRFAKAYDDLLTETHRLRHGHKAASPRTHLKVGGDSGGINVEEKQ